uniref:ATP synthase complex subunit 8 n=2 Tax=Orisarma TaxID=2884567 RepID=A0A343A6Z4_9EUCA|nr:ATP synthase F0 subunit 8 [Orisarma neglectum]YP_009567682.1 ATP synthase F0 subunit 8 [Orisarma dehaani]AOY41438.1 ATP synthase F0 subunit 8 [Orisarma neglectum]QBB87169.1 ATP synthase F0 subunit 8 [Orisarma dehaani]
MPQMAPLYWLYLFFFFLLMFLLFFMLNYFIKPFNNMSSISYDNKIISKSWKL